MGTSLSKYVENYVNAAFYFGQGHDLTKRFSDFRCSRLDYPDETLLQLFLNAFSDSIGILLLPYVYYVGEHQADVVNDVKNG